MNDTAEQAAIEAATATSTAVARSFFFKRFLTDTESPSFKRGHVFFVVCHQAMNMVFRKNPAEYSSSVVIFPIRNHSKVNHIGAMTMITLLQILFITVFFYGLGIVIHLLMQKIKD